MKNWCPNCGGRWERVSYSDYEYICDTCCMRLIDGKLISRDCECDDGHKKGLKFDMEYGNRTLNAVEQAIFEYKKTTRLDLMEEDYFEAIIIVDSLHDKKLIPYGTYELFITAERSCGFINSRIKDGKFTFTDIDLSMFTSEHLPSEPEDEAFMNIYTVVNRLLNEANM